MGGAATGRLRVCSARTGQDRLSVAHRNHAPGQRPARRRQRGPQRAGGLRQSLVRRRLPARAGRSDRLRAPLRAPDVRGLGARREDRAHESGAGQRRLAERDHQPGPDELLRDACRSEHLELALWLEADRMGGLVPALTQETLDNQREVVKNERRQRYENVPYGDAWLRLLPLLYPPGHPYHHATIGSMEDLNAAEPGHVQGVPPAVLRAEQRGADRRRRHLAGRGVRAGGEVLRHARAGLRHPAGARRAHPRPGHRAGPGDGDRQRSRPRGSTCRTAPTRSAPPGTTRSPCSPPCWAAAVAAGSTSGSRTARGSPSRTTSARTASTWRTPRPR